MKVQTRTLCLIEKDNIICDRCGISINQRLYKNNRIALKSIILGELNEKSESN